MEATHTKEMSVGARHIVANIDVDPNMGEQGELQDSIDSFFPVESLIGTTILYGGVL